MRGALLDKRFRAFLCVGCGEELPRRRVRLVQCFDVAGSQVPVERDDDALVVMRLPVFLAFVIPICAIDLGLAFPLATPMSVGLPPE